MAKPTLDEAILMARHAPVPPFPEDAEVAGLLRRIGWQATKSDLAEIEKHQATRERAKVVYDSSNRSAFEAAIEVHYARITAATLKPLAQQLCKRSDQIGDLSCRRSRGAA